MKIRTLGKIKGRVKVSEEIYNIVENPPNILIRRPSCSTKDHFTSINSRCSHTGPIINGHHSTFIQDQNLTNSFLCVMIFYAHPSPSLCWHYDYFLGPHSLPICINDHLFMSAVFQRSATSWWHFILIVLHISLAKFKLRLPSV